MKQKHALIKELPSYSENIINDYNLYSFNNKIYQVIKGGIDGIVDFVLAVPLISIFENEDYEIERIPIVELDPPTYEQLKELKLELVNCKNKNEESFIKRLNLCSFNIDLFFCTMYLTEGSWLLESGVNYQDSYLYEIESIDSRSNKITVIDLASGLISEIDCFKLRIPSDYELDLISEELSSVLEAKEIENKISLLKSQTQSILDASEGSYIFDEIDELNKNKQVTMDFNNIEETKNTVEESIEIYEFENFRKPKKFSTAYKKIKQIKKTITVKLPINRNYIDRTGSCGIHNNWSYL